MCLLPVEPVSSVRLTPNRLFLFCVPGLVLGPRTPPRSRCLLLRSDISVAQYDVFDMSKGRHPVPTFNPWVLRLEIQRVPSRLFFLVPRELDSLRLGLRYDRGHGTENKGGVETKSERTGGETGDEETLHNMRQRTGTESLGK